MPATLEPKTLPDVLADQPREAIHRLADWASDEPVVFVTGVPRSGTTRLYDLFLNAPEFKRTRGAYVESHLVEVIDKLPDYRKRRPLWEFVGEPTEAEDALDRLIGASTVLPPHARWRAGVQSVIYATRLYGGMSRVVEKTPTHAQHMDLLAYALPSARFLFIHRHPVTVLASMRKRLAKERAKGSPEHSLRWLDKTPAEFCWIYRDICRDALRSKRVLGDRVHVLSYERFVAEPERESHAAFDAMGVRFEPAYLAPAHAPGNVIDEKLYQPIAPPEDDWRERVSTDEARDIQARLGDLLDTLGQERLAP